MIDVSATHLSKIKANLHKAPVAKHCHSQALFLSVNYEPTDECANGTKIRSQT